MVIQEKHNWDTGFIRSTWWDGHRDLAYIHEPFNNPADVTEWRDLGYTQAKFTGEMYDMRNLEPAWIDPFRTLFDWQHFSWSVYRMLPGTVLPNHSDTYDRFRKIYNIADIETIWRAVVFLEDWDSGHYFEIDQRPITDWSAGEYVIWRGTTQHIDANMGRTPRYTLEITGIPDSNPLS